MMQTCKYVQTPVVCTRSLPVCASCVSQSGVALGLGYRAVSPRLMLIPALSKGRCHTGPGLKVAKVTMVLALSVRSH